MPCCWELPLSNEKFKCRGQSLLVVKGLSQNDQLHSAALSVAYSCEWIWLSRALPTFTSCPTVHGVQLLVFTPQSIPVSAVGKGTLVTGMQFIVLLGMKYAVIRHIITSAGASYMHCKKEYIFCRQDIDIFQAVAK